MGIKRAFRFFSHFGRQLRRLGVDDAGQGTVEYILILSVSLVGAIAFARTVLGALDRGILRFGAELERDLKTGRASLDVWDN
jgi:hypothetical protein